MPDHQDQRRYAPATDRNRGPICSLLKTVLPAEGTVLEIASGTGQHALFFAHQLAPRPWLPSDPSPIARASIRSWTDRQPLNTLYPPLDLDVTDTDWVQQVQNWQANAGASSVPISAIVAINMIHIAPWDACKGLIAGAAALLPEAGILYLYGPFKRHGQHTAPSNEAFDHSLRSRDPDWGVRDLEAVSSLALNHQFAIDKVVDMPANNLSVVFKVESTA